MQEKTKQKNSRKGQMGLDTSKTVMLVLLTVGVLGFLTIILLGNLTDTNVAVTSGTIGAQSETITSVAHASRPLGFNDRLDCTATVSDVRNATGGAFINATNYTVSGCTILYKTGQGNPSGFNNSNWVVNYSGTFNSFGSVNANLTSGTTSFFTNTSTWFSLLAVVVVILIIAIVIFAVNRFGGRETGF